MQESIVELIIMPLKHPSLFDGTLLRPPRGILLYGPPGAALKR